jgi:PncC family amidohydrolase
MEFNELEWNLSESAEQTAQLLESQNNKVVFAESCTGGKMASAMTGVPGVSASFCGSAVTYREDTKTRWLDVDPKRLALHSAESEFATKAMAEGVLEATPEASVCISITGHLGPNVDSEVDGIVFVAFMDRENESLCFSHQLSSRDRKSRQTEAAYIAIERFREWLIEKSG